MKIQVHDGLGNRNTTLQNDEAFIDFLHKISKIIKRPTQHIEIVFEGPWSAKIGTKKCVSYITNDEELDEFRLQYEAYRQSLQKKTKPPGRDVEVTGVILYNLLDGIPVSRLRVLIGELLIQSLESGKGVRWS